MRTIRILLIARDDANLLASRQSIKDIHAVKSDETIIIILFASCSQYECVSMLEHLYIAKK